MAGGCNRRGWSQSGDEETYGVNPGFGGGGGLDRGRRSDDLLDRFNVFDTDEFLVEAVVEVAEAVGVEAELVQDRRVESLDVHGVFDGGGAEFIGRADADAALDAATGSPHGEAVGVVIAA